VGCFGGHGVPKVSQLPGEPEEIPCEGSGRDPPVDGVCGDSRVAEASHSLRQRHRAAILSDIIINENLKLLQINYLARKMDVLFNIPSRSHCTYNGTYGNT
jgi:hypothetical protein